MRLGILFIAGLMLSGLNCSPQTKQHSELSTEPTNGYKYRKASPDGIGKFYLDREISHVMGAGGSAWLDRSERVSEEAPMQAIENLPLNKHSVVADIGAGTGYYTFRIAPELSAGKIYAVELQDEMINMLKQKKELGKLQNVEIIKGTNTSVNLPDNSIDLAFMVDVYHELEFPVEMLRSVHKALKPSGRLVLIEYRGEDPSIPIKPLHKMTVKQVRKELEKNGFRFESNGEFLPIQHFIMFKK